MRKTKSKKQISRRRFLEGTGVGIVAATAAPTIKAQSPSAVTAKIAPDPAVPRTTIRVTVNGAAQHVEVEDRWTLVEMLRDAMLEKSRQQLGNGDLARFAAEVAEHKRDPYSLVEEISARVGKN